jgi:hypothetical protein
MDQIGSRVPLVLLTTNKPTERSTGSQALASITGDGKPVLDVIELLDPEDLLRLERYAQTGQKTQRK